ncbi:MAG: hypothetical protein DIZ80_15150 [endosymbiont of Galathealinum brachiosum]|uniref:TIGR04219 family outer membrane beta-barrel protein n=1 Tax=endosymbiont of Galathealinum brachiosum TaxID=2200906 RepID=A0A370D935_9GAMM|nr:MAG: hypothetical protein DIZ80_15150 [endosymbiont of Galathealinum brachiosum]
MNNFKLPLLLALSLGTGNASADALGLYVGGGSWNHDANGTFGTLGDDVINVESDLSYSEESDIYYYAAFEHFIPLLPNLRIEGATLGHTGTATNLDFNGVTVTGDSSIDLDTTDAILYWRLLDNWVNFDFGLNIRKLDGEFTIDTETVSVSETVPMLYLAAQFDLPFSGFSVGADINTISLSDVTYQDVRLRAIYEMGIIGFEAGYKTTTLELDDVSNVDADLEFKGIMIGAFLHF